MPVRGGRCCGLWVVCRALGLVPGRETAVRCAGWRTAGSSTTPATSTTRSLRTKRRTRRALHHPHPRRRAVPPVLLLPELGELPLLLLLLLMRRPRQLSSPPSPSTTPSLARQARVFPKPPSLRHQQMARTQPRRCGCVCSRTSGQTSRVRAGPRQVPPQPRAMRHRLPRRSDHSYACCWCGVGRAPTAVAIEKPVRRRGSAVGCVCRGCVWGASSGSCKHVVAVLCHGTVVCAAILVQCCTTFCRQCPLLAHKSTWKRACQPIAAAS